MEGIFFVLIGAALFSQSWYMLGVYSEARTMGIFVGGLGLLALAALFFAPAATVPSSVNSFWLLLTGEGTVKPSDWLAQTMVMKGLVLAWGMYAIGVAAHGLWDFDERAIGFYSVFLAVLSAISFIYFVVELEPAYGTGTWLGLSAATLLLTVLAGMMFFTLSFTFHVLRVVTGWFILIGGGAVAAVGLGVLSSAISSA